MTSGEEAGAGAETTSSLEDLLRACTVQVTNGERTCAGFFLTPTIVVTSGPVASRVRAISLGWSKNGQPLEYRPALAVKSFFLEGPPIAVLSFEGFDGHPCVRLGEDKMTRLGDPCIAIGPPPDSHVDRFAWSAADSALPERSRSERLEPEIVAPAADTSLTTRGAAVLNLRTKGICGFLSLAPDGSATPLVVPIRTLQMLLGDTVVTNQIFHLYDSRWAVAAGDAIPDKLNLLDPAPNPDAITTRNEFMAAFSDLRRLSGQTVEWAASMALSHGTEHGYFSGVTLPPNIETVFTLVKACGVNEPTVIRKWLAAWRRVTQTGFEYADQDNLLFRLYIPADRLYAAEASRLLSLFRDWLVTTRGQSVRHSGFGTPSGEMFEFFTDATEARPDLREQLDGFSNFLVLCTEDPSAAVATLASLGLGAAISEDFVSRFGREVRRLQRELTHQRERRILEIQHSVEEDLIEAGCELRALPRGPIRALIESLVPGASAPDSLALLAAPQPTPIPASVTINQPQIIYAVESAIFQRVRGGIHFGPQASELLALIDRFGGQEAANLESDLNVLTDPVAPRPARSRAKDRLKQFVGQLPGTTRDIAVDLLERLIARSLGLGG
jgi:hypothetical protein